MSIVVNISDVSGKINFEPSNSQLNKIQSSFKSDPNAIGNLRWHGVSNGRYENYHPVSEIDESLIGYFEGGQSEIGYTYCCLYSDQANRFFLSHVLFSMVWNKGITNKKSFISTIEPTGKYRFFRKGLKYTRTSSLTFHEKWVSSENIFCFINDGRSLLCVTGLGICLINVFNSDTVFTTLFGNEYPHMLSGVEISPNMNILVTLMSEWKYNDPVKGEDIYNNSVQVYNTNTGKKLGTIDIDIKNRIYKCDIKFNNAGDVISISNHDFTKLFKLETNKI